MNTEAVPANVIPCHTENGCEMGGSMSSVYLFGVLILIALAIQIFLQTKALQALSKFRK